MTNITIKQATIFGGNDHRPVFTMEDFPCDIGMHDDVLSYLYGVLNNHGTMLSYGCPAYMRSLSVGDIVVLDEGSFGNTSYVLGSTGWTRN